MDVSFEDYHQSCIDGQSMQLHLLQSRVSQVNSRVSLPSLLGRLFFCICICGIKFVYCLSNVSRQRAVEL